jgi:hypothetical protein
LAGSHRRKSGPLPRQDRGKQRAAPTSCVSARVSEVGEEAVVGASEGAATEDDGANGAGSFGVGNANIAAGRSFVDGHFGDDGYAHACADHAEETAELTALENDLWMKTGTIASGDGGVTKAMAVAE